MGLNLIVCIKSVILKPPEGEIIRSEDLLQLNPYDRPAVEAALRLREIHGGAVTTLSMGPEAANAALEETLAMGADRGILLSDPAFKGSDTLATSTILSAGIRKLAPFDLVLFGTRSADSDTGQVGPQTAVALGIPIITGVHSMELTGADLQVERRMDGFMEKYSVSFPAALSVSLRSFEPVDIGLAAIEAAFEKKALETWTLKDLDLSPDMTGDAGSPTRVISMTKVKKGRTCELLQGAPAEQADQLVVRLKESGML
ncbi:MAG: electron transfer flavoprotein subunit beta/FixA family protein [Candidatus Desulfacyla sp.]